MSAEEILKQRMHRQCKNAATLLTEGGYHYPIIAHASYNDRHKIKSAPFRKGWGARPMHATTFVIAKPPWEPDYTTTNKQDFGGSKSLNPVGPAEQNRSMHFCNYYLGVPHRDEPWHTNYSQDYAPLDLIPANRLHQQAQTTLKTQRSGADVRAAVKPSGEKTSYWSHYNSTHGKLGLMLGPGVRRDYPARRQYNFITGEMGKPAWKPDNRRVSGNRILHAKRASERKSSIIS